MVKRSRSKIVFALVMLMLMHVASAAPLLSSGDIGFDGQTRSNNYDALVDSVFNNDKVVTTIDGRLLWTPWYETSSSSLITDLQDGANCNSGQTIDYTHNCMVTDEFSQIGIIASMGRIQSRMDTFYNTIIAAKSSFGSIPGWRIYRDGNAIQACKPGINGNCDTASDATARIIIALFTASKNPLFVDSAKKENYAILAKNLANDMLAYEVDRTCRPTGFGTVCNWLASGANAKNGGIGSNDFAFTGYYPDAIIAMLQAYAYTNDVKYYDAAKDFTLNYLQAANFNGKEFSAPPGKSFRWVVDSLGVPKAQCTNSCSPIAWDGYDAPRALGMCQAQYYAKEMGVELPELQKYCSVLTQKHMGSTASVPLQYYPNGEAVSLQSGYFAQGLQALHFSGVDPVSFRGSLDRALSHYIPSTRTFDYAPSIGVYTQSFAVRALGMGIGRDSNAFKLQVAASAPATTVTMDQVATPTAQESSIVQELQEPFTTGGIGKLSRSAVYGQTNVPATVKIDSTSGVCRTIVWTSANGDIRTFACEKGGGYVELYLQGAPPNLPFKACLANGCVSKDNGFARFIPGFIPIESAQTQVVSQPTAVVTAPTLILAPTPEVKKSIGDLSVSNTYNSIQSSVKSDVTSGACRTVVFSTTNGDVQILGCEKSGGYIEVYRQMYPNNFAFKACMGSGCVDNYGGFARVLA